MAYTPFPVEGFGGLDVYRDSQEVGATGAIDTLNAELDQPGRVRSRDGSSLFTSVAGTNAFSAMAYYKPIGADEWIVVADGSTLRTYKLSDASAGATQTSATVQSNNAFARFGTTSNSYLYATCRADGLKRWDGSAWSSPVITPKPSLCAVTAENRLAISDFDSVTSTPKSTVWFSDADAPETYGVNNYVTLWAGDGQYLTGLVRWRELLFAFKQSKFAVFYSTTEGPDGNPEFNARPVDTGHGVIREGGAVAGDEGVYFADRTGIYLTTGGEPVYISRALEPWLKTGTYDSLPTFSLANAQLVYHAQRLYVVDSSGTPTTLVYDPARQAWLVWRFGASSAVSIPLESSLHNLYFGDTSSKKVAKMDSSVATDLGAAMVSRHQSGFYDMAEAGRDVYTRWTRLWGSGSPTISVFTNMGSSDSNAAAVTLGTSPTVAHGYHQKSYKGQLFSHKLSATSGAWSVSRLQHDIAFVRP